MMDGVLFPVIVQGIKTRVDGSLSITVETPELSDSKVGEVFGLRKKPAMMYLSPKDIISQKEIDQVNAIDAEIEGKTPSKRLRDVIYVLFTQQPDGYKDFELFYKFKMNQITEHLKSKLQ